LSQPQVTHADVTSTQCFVIEVHHPGFVRDESAHKIALTSLYFLQGQLTADNAHSIAGELLADPVTETYTVSVSGAPIHSDASHTIDITLLPGVTDPAAENLLLAAREIGVTGLSAAATGQRYRIYDDLSVEALHQLAVSELCNLVIQRFTVDEPIAPPLVPVQGRDDTIETIPLNNADDERLRAISAERRLSLNLQEMQAIRAYFQNEGREPTDAELEMLAQTWSEHCVHKTFKASIEYTSDIGTELIDGLLKTYIRAATERINKPWVRSAFIDNAGIVAFDDHWDLAFKVETHNHPSALEPFGGANTGVGGVVRDILGVSARPIANTDVLCFGPTDLPNSALPAGVLHPRRIAAGVIHGVEDYGNKMGIPTVNGAILYHHGYISNPLVYCGCLGILPRGAHVTAPQPGDLIVVLGGRTGRDGLRGATFSSMEMDTTTGEIAGSAVQIGHPIHEKQVLEVVLRARDAKLYHAITDCGAGGLSSAVGEMAKDIGARVQLETVPLKYSGLRPWEIWLSEAQERMVLAVAPSDWPEFKTICDGQDIEAISIGTLEPTGRLELYNGDQIVGSLTMEFLHDGIPRRHLHADWRQPTYTQQLNVPEPIDLTPTLLALLAHPNIYSKADTIHRYDHEVQGGTALKPLVGVENHGPSDAAVLRPHDTHPSTRGAALAAGVCPSYGELDPYAMAWAAVDETFRNLTAVGADPDQVSLLDNFCWGNANLPDRLGSLVRCAQGCYDAAVAYKAPYISGKDSLNNEYADENGQRHAIPGTLLISGLGIVPDVQQTVTMDLKQPGSALYVVGQTRDEMGGSHYALINGRNEGVPPQPVENALDLLRALHRAIQAGLVASCHDCSEGGIGVALAEMCLAGRLGAEIDTNYIPGVNNITGDSLIQRDDVALFSESLTRFVVEVAPEHAAAFEAHFTAFPCARIGKVNSSGVLNIRGQRERDVVRVLVDALETAWRGETETIPPTPSRQSELSNTLVNSPLPEFDVSRAAGSGVGLQRPRILILHATGTNRDRDAALACELAGGQPEIVHINQLLSGERRLVDYHMLVIPGGFSYGDDLGAGKLWAVNLKHRLGEAVQQFVDSGRPVLGICNGFQTLVKAGLLPGNQPATLTFNESGKFECRWVTLQPNPDSPSVFTRGLTEPIECPVAHGEGRFVASDGEALGNLVALTYINPDGSAATYPANPNGSTLGIAGVCNSAGNVLGLMPHPENHIFPWQHPHFRRGEPGRSGLQLFANGVKYAQL
jgi:phosphoribosylformylglycinamidine synthase II/phosphoribosylformylglycinamidine synthase I